jgi:hypothetical protein
MSDAIKPATSVALALALAGVLSAITGCAAPRFATRAGPGTVAETPGRAAVVVRVPMPWYAPRFVVRGKFRDVLGEYEGLQSLEAKYFTISDAREFGGLYLWSSREAAERHFDAAWRAQVRARRNAEADVVILDVPFVVEGRTELRGEPAGRRSVATADASATFARWRVPEAATAARARALAERLAGESGLVRAFVVTSPGAVGAIVLWASRDLSARAAALEPAAPSQLVRFEAPLLVDEALRTAGAR